MNDSIGLYLNDIGKVSLLNAEEERELSRAIEAGREAAARLEKGEKGAELKREAERRRQETAEIRRLLPPDEAAHLVNAATNAAGELVIMMDTPAWAARVRYCVGVLPNKRVRISVLPRGG